MNIYTKLTLIAILLIQGLTVLAKEANLNIATVDSNKILQSYSDAQKMLQDMSKLEADLNKKIKAKREELEKAKAAGKTDTELQLMAEQMRQEIEPEARKIEDESKRRSEGIETTIHQAIQDTAKDSKYDLVLSKDAVLYGGTDISELVVKKLSAPAAAKPGK